MMTNTCATCMFFRRYEQNLYPDDPYGACFVRPGAQAPVEATRLACREYTPQPVPSSVQMMLPRWEQVGKVIDAIYHGADGELPDWEITDAYVAFHQLYDEMQAIAKVSHA